MNKLKKILTIEDLIKFCVESNLYNFDSKATGYQLSVRVPASFEVQDNENDTLLYAYTKLFHIGINRNRSSVTKEAAEKSLSAIKYKPILANFTNDTPDGQEDFTSHDMILDDNGDIIYLERQVGCFTSDEPYIEYDDEEEKDFVYAKIAIPREYTNAAEIIERKNGTKISVELLINAMEFNAKEKVLELTDITVQGATLLGYDPKRQENVEEGMKGAKVSLEDFSVKNNSMFSNVEINEQLVNTLEKLNTTLSSFNINEENQKGGSDSMNKFEELLAKYNKAKEDITFDYELLPDDELEERFAEVFEEDDENPASDGTSDEEGEPEAKEQGGEDSESEDFKKKKGKKRCSIDLDGKVFEFDLSLNEKIYALQDLINITYGDTDETYYGVQAYDTYVIMVDYWYNKSYKQSYSEKDGVFTLVGDRVEVFSNWLTAEEEAALAEMRANYAIIQEKLDTYEKAENDAKKDEIFADKAYQEYLGTEDFKTLINDKDKYSVDELKEKADLVFAKCVKQTGAFGLKPEESKETNKRTFVSNKNKAKNSPYGSIFANKN